MRSWRSLTTTKPRMSWLETDSEKVSSSNDHNLFCNVNISFIDEIEKKNKVAIIIEPVRLFGYDVPCSTGYFFYKNSITGKVDMTYCIKEPHRERLQKPLETRRIFQNISSFGIATLIHLESKETVFELTSEYCDKDFPLDVDFRRYSNYEAIIDSVNRLINIVLSEDKVPFCTAYPLCPVIDNVIAFFRGSGIPTVIKDVYPPIPNHWNDGSFSIDYSDPIYIESVNIEAKGTCKLEALGIEVMALKVDSIPVLVLARQ